jgi:hypothetical protein
VCLGEFWKELQGIEMIEEAPIYLVPSIFGHTVVPDWCKCRRLEIEHGHVTTQMIIRELNVTPEKARKILMRWESMKNAQEIQSNLRKE